MAYFPILVIAVYLSGVVLALKLGAHWAFYLYQLVYFLNPEDRWWSSYLPSFGYSFSTVMLLFFTYLINYKKYTENKLHKLPQLKWIILLLIIYSITTLYAVDQDVHKTALNEFIKMFLTLSIAFKVISSFEKLEWSLLVYIVGAAYIGYEAYVIGRNYAGRVEGIGLVDGRDANFAASALVASIPLIIYFLWWGNRYIKVSMIFLGPLVVNGLILLNSRGAFLGAGVGIIFFMWTMFFSKFKTNKQKTIAISLAIVGIIGLASLVDKSFLDRMETLTNVQDESKSGSHRYRMWLATFDLLEDYPFGAGARGFQLLSRNYVPEDLLRGQNVKAVHSMWFQALSEIGWLGFLVFLLVILSTFYTLNKIKQSFRLQENYRYYYLAHALHSAFIGTLVTGSFINQFRTQMVYWCILFISCLYSIGITERVMSSNADQK